jgi:hypothetical protein
MEQGHGISQQAFRLVFGHAPCLATPILEISLLMNMTALARGVPDLDHISPARPSLSERPCASNHPPPNLSQAKRSRPFSSGFSSVIPWPRGAKWNGEYLVVDVDDFVDFDFTRDAIASSFCIPRNQNG